jgi:NAD(P)-dependent dehydrogenase (short-subunit alcohol dehydrogenase family)
MTRQLDGQVAIVTGAGRGIGRGCAEALADAGARVIAIARSEAELAEGLSILVNNAGGNRPQAFVDVDTESLDFIIDLNVRAAFRVAQAATRAMLAAGTKGSIVHMSSQMGHVGSPNRTVYCMTKHAIEGLTKAMAVELAPQGIRVNAICPTFIKTAMTAPFFENEDFMAKVHQKILLGRVGEVEDLMGAILYLASDASSLVTGSSLLIDGGWTAI